MSIITKATTNSSVLQNIGISALKGAAINLGVQAVGSNVFNTGTIRLVKYPNYYV